MRIFYTVVLHLICHYLSAPPPLNDLQHPWCLRFWVSELFLLLIWRFSYVFVAHFTLFDFPLLSCRIRLSSPLFMGFVKLPLCIRPHLDGTSFQMKHSRCGSAFLSHARCAGTLETENFWKQVPKCNLLKMQPPVWPRKVAEQSAWEPGDVTAHFTALKKNVLCTDMRFRLLFWTSSLHGRLPGWHAYFNVFSCFCKLEYNLKTRRKDFSTLTNFHLNVA